MRTEQEILKDFEALGYKIIENNKFTLKLSDCDGGYLDIDKKDKMYILYLCDNDDGSWLDVMWFNMQEHKLLNELFTIWRWI